MYTIIDIETTGPSPKRDKITEIAIFLHDGVKIIEEYTTLVNPERLIPPFITQLTGITNEMVADAPKFYEIAKKVIEITEDQIFVAHNVNFDYGFIQSEFERLGYSYSRKKICTVKLSRKLIPGKKSYSLGKLCNELGIHINNRHRAAGDAIATVKVLEKLISLNGDTPASDNIILPTALAGINPILDPQKIKTLPQEPGVYYFHNDENEVIYIGKSKSICQRVISHFHNNRSKRAIEMKNQIADISYEKTGNELIALLKEAEEIKSNKPKFNRALRRSRNHWGIYLFNDENGYINLKTEKNTIKNGIPVVCFESQIKAKSALNKLIEQFNLCQKLCGLYDSQQACFHYQIGECQGACTGEEDKQAYNNRVNEAISTFRLSRKNMLIIDKGRFESEKSVVKIENGKYIGYGYVDFEMISNNIEEIHECIQIFNDNHDVQMIIKSYLNNNKVEAIIKF